MRELLLVVAAIFALNVAYAAFLLVSELVHRWRTRREVGTLEAMWFADRREAGGHARRSVGRIALAGASLLLLLSGLAVDSPMRSVVDHVTRAIGGLPGPIGDPDVVAAPSGEEDTGSPALAPSVGPRTSTDPSRDGPDPNGDDAGAAPSTTDPSQRGGSPDPPLDHATEQPPSGETSTPSDGGSTPSPTVELPNSPSPDPSPFVVDAATPSSTVVALTWDRFDSAKRYDVEIFDTGEGVWARLASLPAGKRSYVIDEREPGVTYDFRVTASLAQGEPVTDVVTVEMPLS